MSAVVKNFPEKHRFELDVDGQTVFADYRDEGGVLHILHVEAPVALRGTGAAGKFMEGMVGLVRAEGLQVRPICPYAVMWLKRHGEYSDLIG